MKLFLIMLIVTIVEVVLIAKVGSLIGFFNTFLIILTTAMIGSWQLRKQGLSVLQKLQKNQEPSEAMLEGLILLICGILLITPGFLTDLVGFMGLFPALRIRFAHFLKKHQSSILGKATSKSTFFYSYQQTSNRPEQDSNIIDGEVIQEEDESKQKLN